MKVGNLVGGLEVVDVMRVNKLNLVQFLKEVDSYLQQGYKIDVNSARQVGLVLQVDTYKTESPSSPKVESVGTSPKVGSTGVKEEVVSPKAETKVEQETEALVEDAVGEPETVTDVPVKKPTTTRSKKTATQ